MFHDNFLCLFSQYCICTFLFQEKLGSAKYAFKVFFFVNTLVLPDNTCFIWMIIFFDLFNCYTLDCFGSLQDRRLTWYVPGSGVKNGHFCSFHFCTHFHSVISLTLVLFFCLSLSLFSFSFLLFFCFSLYFYFVYSVFALLHTHKFHALFKDKPSM